MTRTCSKAFREVLVEEGFEIFTASRGDVGLDLLNSVVPDLIICDVMMPGMDGYEVLGEISKNETFATIPLFFLPPVMRGMISERQWIW